MTIPALLATGLVCALLLVFRAVQRIRATATTFAKRDAP